MSLAALIDALGLPEATRVDRRVPKKLLLEQAATSAEDRRRIQDGIDELVWVAALKAENIGVPTFKDEQRDYVEVAVLTATLRSDAKTGALVKLIHRAIPYPVVLGILHDGALSLSVAHKRRSLGPKGEVVLEEVVQTRPLRVGGAVEVEFDRAFLTSLALAEAPQGDLFRLYEGLHDRVAALEAATVTGAFRLVSTAEEARVRREALAAHARLQRDLGALRGQAERETQMSRRVDLNLAIRRLLGELAAVEKLL